MTDDEKRDAGIKMFDAVYGGVVSLPPGAATHSEFVDIMLRNLFSEVWGRDVLSIRDRRLLLLGAVAALGDPTIMEIQLRAAFTKGELTAEQMNEILIFLVNYVGYPRGTIIQGAISRVLADVKPK